MGLGTFLLINLRAIWSTISRLPVRKRRKRATKTATDKNQILWEINFLHCLLGAVAVLQVSFSTLPLPILAPRGHSTMATPVYATG